MQLLSEESECLLSVRHVSTNRKSAELVDFSLLVGSCLAIAKKQCNASEIVRFGLLLSFVT